MMLRQWGPFYLPPGSTSCCVSVMCWSPAFVSRESVGVVKKLRYVFSSQCKEVGLWRPEVKVSTVVYPLWTSTYFFFYTTSVFKILSKLTGELASYMPRAEKFSNEEFGTSIVVIKQNEWIEIVYKKGSCGLCPVQLEVANLYPVFWGVDVLCIFLIQKLYALYTSILLCFI